MKAIPQKHFQSNRLILDTFYNNKTPSITRRISKMERAGKAQKYTPKEI
jgi:hypothetical protein